MSRTLSSSFFWVNYHFVFSVCLFLERMNNDGEEGARKGKQPIEPIAPELGFSSAFQILTHRINYASSPLLEYAYPPINETIVANITNGSTV